MWEVANENGKKAHEKKIYTCVEIMAKVHPCEKK